MENLPEEHPVPLGLAAASFALALGLIVNSVLGPLGLKVIDYPISGTLLNQVIGLEIVSLGLVVPMALLAGMLALRGRRGAATLALGPATYSAYMLVQYVLGPEYPAYTAVALFHTGLFTLSALLVGWAWQSASREPLPHLSARERRVNATVLWLLALFILSRYSGALTGGRLPAEFAQAHTFYWSIFLLDLGLVVPATVAIGIGLVRGSRVAQRASYAVLLWYALVPPSVAAMSLSMLVNDDPHTSLGQALALSMFAIVFMVLAARLCRPLLRPAGSAGLMTRQGGDSRLSLPDPENASLKASKQWAASQPPDGGKDHDHPATPH